MSNEKVVYTSGGPSLLTALAIVFIILKITGTTAVATWSWWWVLAPIWIPVAMILGIMMVAFLFLLLIAVVAAIGGK